MNPIRFAVAVVLAAVIVASFVHAAETAWYLPPAAVIRRPRHVDRDAALRGPRGPAPASVDARNDGSPRGGGGFRS
jgi:hypothetical protein